jgi:3-phosphoshikimate 1-carboxyvinyltransferase
MKKNIQPGKRFGTIAIPASKSDGQRALLAAALSKGESKLINLGESKDELAMLSAIKNLGAKVKQLDESTFIVKGIQTFPKEAELNMGESGLGIRLITSVCAAHMGVYMIYGKGSLEKRPLTFFEDTLPLFNAGISSNAGLIPLEITGPMRGSTVELDGSQSSQYISGMMMALPLLKEDSRIHVSNLNSLPYLQMTLDTLNKFGIEVSHQNYEDFIIRGNQNYISTTYSIESDWSSASYWLVASALGYNIQLTGLSMTSLQADKNILEAFEAANCLVEFRENKIRINGKNRKPFKFDATHCPDLFPALATFASLCDGKSEIKGVSRLTHKESNRGIVLQEEFANIGVVIILDGDIMHIHGKNSIEGGKVNSHNDHRIAMCFAIAGLFSDDEIEINGAEAVAKSYPTFWVDLEGLFVDSRIN